MTRPDDLATALIAAGLQALLVQPHRVLERGLRSEDAINIADASPATFYRKFPTKNDFLAAVLDELGRVDRRTPDDLRAVVTALLADETSTVRTLVGALVDAHFEELTDRDSVTRHVLTHSFAEATPKNARELRAEYRRVDELVLAVFEAFTDQFGATLRKPFTPKTFATAITAIVEGCALRSRLDPETVSPELLTEIILAVVGATVMTTGDHQHLDDVLAGLARNPTLGPVPRDMRAAIVNATRDEFAKRGYFSTNLDEIARIAGVPQSTARRLFPTKPHILVAALRSRVLSLGEAVADDVLVQLDEATIIENHLLRCAYLVAEETALMDALLVAVAHDTFSEPEGLISVKENLNFPAIIAPVIQQGQDKGVFATIESPSELAAGLTNTLLIRCFTRRGKTPEENAGFVGNLFLRGLVRDTRKSIT